MRCLSVSGGRFCIRIRLNEVSDIFAVSFVDALLSFDDYVRVGLVYSEELSA